MEGTIIFSSCPFRWLKSRCSTDSCRDWGKKTFLSAGGVKVCGQCDQEGVCGHNRLKLINLAIKWTKITAPLRYKMCLVNGNCQYSRLPHNVYPLVDSPGYELWGVMHHEGATLVWNTGLVATKIMRYEGVCVMRGMRYEGYALWGVCVMRGMHYEGYALWGCQL